MAIVIVHGPFLCFSIFMITFPIITSSITEFEALINLKQSFTNVSALDSWKLGTSPCSGLWVGIACENGLVSAVHLENSSLSGIIDIEALTSLPSLKSIALTSNAFSGPVPDFGRIQPLKGLYITDNQFSGDIRSDYFSNTAGLERLWLARNNFSGPIPSSLAKLPRLMELHLENNRFSGNVPIFEQQSLISVNLSNNNLEGEIPTGLSKFGPSSFDGNPGLCGLSSGRSCPKPPPSKQKKLMVTIVSLVVFTVLLLLMVAGIYLMRRKNEGAKESVDLNLNPLGSISELEVMNNEKSTFGMGDLMSADAEILGTGPLGSSYKATMPSGFTVAVKRMTETSSIGREKFDEAMWKFGSLEHRNVLPPLAYHYREDEKLLVYEYQHTGSLMFLLHGDRGISHANLNWPVRMNIIRGIARGLSYLHTTLALNLPHGNLKSSNVLLSPDYQPLLVDYGLCSLISREQAVHSLMAYKSPEAVQDQDNVSPKCDVYCLDIVILEILTGRFPGEYHSNLQGGTNLVQWVRSAIAEGREVELLNPDIANAAEFVCEMERLIRIGADCTEDEPDRRLDLREAIRRIEAKGNDQTFHILPSLKDGILEESSKVAIQSTSRIDSVGDHSGRSFVFQIP